MDKYKYKDIVRRHSPKEDIFINPIIAFIVGGIMGMIGQLLIDVYSYAFSLSTKEAAVLMIVSLIFIGCLFTSLGFFDKWVHKFKCGLIILEAIIKPSPLLAQALYIPKYGIPILEAARLDATI